MPLSRGRFAPKVAGMLMSPTQVLLVEDDTVERLALAGVLKRQPHLDVVEACDGQQAWEMLEGGLRPDVCFSDIRMPRLDGLALVERARAHPVLALMPIILLTARADRITVQRAIEQRVAGFMVKPASGLDTHAAIERVVRQAQFRRAERAQTTCGRLGLDLAGLLALLADMAGELAQLHGEAASLPAPVAGRLVRTARALGLWQAAELLERLRAGATEHAACILEEVQRLVTLQMRATERLPRLRGTPVWAAGRAEGGSTLSLDHVAEGGLPA